MLRLKKESSHAYNNHTSREPRRGDRVMNDLPAIELLEAHHTFPGPYLFKVIGRVENGFVARVVAAVREELAGDKDPPFKVRETAGGRHVSVSLEPTVQTAEQVLAVYRRIRTTAGLVMLL
jgi:putative lipoic acid-binding regulatory protein